ncbi:MAG: SRPBCC family protein [Abditibacteriota bacterium]|nr:SRPBCC family protein [Abditibacteriota bacterium]
MPIVKSSIDVNAPLDVLYNTAKDIEAFPEFMSDVKSVEILERKPDGTVSSWVGIVKEFATTIKWVEDDTWDDEAKTCVFKLVKGDYSKYSGVWTFTDLGGGKSRFESEIEVEYDVPMIGALIRGLIAKKMKENVDGMLKAIKEKIEQ